METPSGPQKSTLSKKSQYKLSSTVYIVSPIALERVDILAQANMVRGVFWDLSHVCKFVHLGAILLKIPL